MILYLIIQTIVFSLAAGLYIYGEYQSNDYLVSRRRDLFQNISFAIVTIFAADILAIVMFFAIQKG